MDKKKKKKNYLYAACKRHIKCRDTHKLKVKKLEKILHANGNQNKAVVATLKTNREEIGRSLHND